MLRDIRVLQEKDPFNNRKNRLSKKQISNVGGPVDGRVFVNNRQLPTTDWNLMGKAKTFNPSLALLIAMASLILSSVSASLSANEASIDAIRAAEERVAAEHGMTVEEFRSKVANECFERVRERDFEGSEGGIFNAKDARYSAEYGCANLAIVGPSAIENSQ